MHKLYINIFLFASLVFGAKTINIPLDPISHNTYRLNSINPVFQDDSFNGGYFVEGNMGSAISVYLVDDLYLDTNDSIRTKSSFRYKQGDVGYRDFSLDIRSKVAKTGTLKFLANGRTYPGRFSQYADDNILQNYILSFTKDYESSRFSFYTAYHLEDLETQYINSNSGESHLLGIGYDIYDERYNLNFNYALQTGETNFNELVNYNINWLIADLGYNINDKIRIWLNNKAKFFHLNSNEYMLGNVMLGTTVNSNLLEFQIGTRLLDSISHPELSIKTKFKRFNIYLGLSNDNWFDLSAYSAKDYCYYYWSFSYLNDNVNIQIEPRYIEYNNKSYLSFSNTFDLKFDLVQSEVDIIPFFLKLYKTRVVFSTQNNYYHSSDLIVKNYIESSLDLFEFESKNRYRKSIGLKYKGVQFNNIYSINLEDVSLYSNGSAWYWNDNTIKNYLDFYIGIEFEKFILSWHFTNILSENFLINKDENIIDFNMTYFKVQWKFDN